MFQLDARIPLGFQGFDPAVGQRNALMRLQQQAAEADLDERNALNAALQRAGAGLSADDPAKRAAAAAEIGQVGPRGYALAAPILTGVRNERQVASIFGSGAPGGGGAPSASPVAAPAGGDMLTRIASVESGGNDAARNPRSSAAGRFQIIDSTWNQYAPRLGLRPDQRMDPQAQEQVARAIQADAERAVGRPLRPGEQYGAHLLGVGGLRAFVSADPNADAQTVYAQAAGPQIAAQAFQRNPGLLEPGSTVGQVMQRLEGRVGGAGGSATPAATRPSQPGQPTQAQFAQLAQAAAAGNEVAQRLVQTWAPFMRQENTVEPLEAVQGPNGPVLVPRSQAAGRAPARAGGGDGLSPAQAAADVRQIAPLIMRGAATPEQEIAYATAVGVWQSTGQRAQVPADPNDPSRGMVEVIVPRPLPEGFPAPRPLQDIVGGGRVPEAPGGAGTVPAATPAPPPAAAPAAPQAAQPGVPLPGTTLTAEPPRNPNAPRPIGPAAPSPAALNDARKLETDARNVALAAERFRAALETFRGGTGAAAFNPRSPEGARLQQAFENFKMSLRGEAFANTGVLQPGENVMLDNILRNPRSLTGLLSSVDASVAQFDELLGYVEDRVNTVREQSRLPRVRIRPDARGDAGGGERPPLNSFFRTPGR